MGSPRRPGEKPRKCGGCRHVVVARVGDGCPRCGVAHTIDEQDRKAGTRRRAGGTAQALGKLWEGVVERELERARAGGVLAWFEHHQPLFRALGGGKYVPVKKGKADFGAMFAGGGLALALECKSNAGGSCERSRFTGPEIEHLDLTLKGGGLALAAFEYRMPLAPWLRFLVPWDRVPWRVSGAGSSVRADDLAGWEMRQDHSLARFVDWCRHCSAWRLRALPRGGTCCCGVRGML